MWQLIHNDDLFGEIWFCNHLRSVPLFRENPLHLTAKKRKKEVYEKLLHVLWNYLSIGAFLGTREVSGLDDPWNPKWGLISDFR